MDVAGVGYAQEVGFDTIIERGLLAAGALPDHVIYARFSFGYYLPPEGIPL
jgi:hypothetical protein